MRLILKNNRQKSCHERGFTLLNMAILLVVMSLLIVPFFQMERLIQVRDSKKKQFGTVGQISQALQSYAKKNGSYPFPADPGANMFTDASAGQPVSSTALAWPPASSTNNFWKSCNQNGVYELSGTKIKCTVKDVAATYGALTTGNPANFPSITEPQKTKDIKSVYTFAVIGVVPYTALGLNAAEALDEYGNKITYAVTYGLTKASTFNNAFGSLTVYKANENALPKCTANATVQEPANGTTYNTCTATRNLSIVPGGANAHFVVIAHGVDGLGAYTASGTAPGALTACTVPRTGNTSLAVKALRTTQGIDGPALAEAENCDNANGSFRAMVNEDLNSVVQTYNLNTGLVKDSNNDWVKPYFDDSIDWATTIYTGQSTSRTLTASAESWLTTPYGTVSYPLYQTYLWGGAPVWVGTAPVGTKVGAVMTLNPTVEAAATQSTAASGPEVGQFQMLGVGNALRASSIAAPLFCGGGSSYKATGCLDPAFFTVVRVGATKNSAVKSVTKYNMNTSVENCTATYAIASASQCTPQENRDAYYKDAVAKAGATAKLGVASTLNSASSLSGSTCVNGARGIYPDGKLLCN